MKLNKDADLSDNFRVSIDGENWLTLSHSSFPGSTEVRSISINANEADALRLWLDDHVQTKNVLV